MRKVIAISTIILTITIISIVSLYLLSKDNAPNNSYFDSTEQAINITANLSTLANDDLNKIIEKGTLRVLVPFNRTDFYLVNGQETGLQVDLMNQYLTFLIETEQSQLFDAGIPLNIVYLPTPYDQLIEDLVLGRGDIAASNISATPDRLNTVNIASSLGLSGKEIIITNKDTQINDINDLSGEKITVMAGSSYQENLESLNKVFIQENKDPIVIDVADRLFTEIDILELVDAGLVSMTVIDDYKATLWAKILTNLNVHNHIVIKETNEIGWAVRKNNPKLLESIESFQDSIKKGTFLGNYLFNKYYQDSRRLTNPLIQSLSDENKNVIKLISQYANQYEFNAAAVIAQAFQESRLDHSMISDKGAVGVMQILPETANDMGFTDISSLDDNIHAGIKYLDYLRKNFITPLGLDKSNEYPFLWAAYNAGPGRISQIREKTEQMGLNKDIWFSNAEFAALNILGKETQNYVSNIYKYFLIYQNNQHMLVQHNILDQKYHASKIVIK